MLPNVRKDPKIKSLHALNVGLYLKVDNIFLYGMKKIYMMCTRIRKMISQIIEEQKMGKIYK